MIASRIGVLIAGALALVLAVVVAIDLARDREPPSRALVVGFDGTRVKRLAWARGGEEAIVVERAGAGEGGTWRWVAPIAGVPANAATIDAALAALRGGKWHRRAAVGKAGVARATLTVDGALTIGVGAPLEGAGQTWLAIGGSAYLVDDWIARALAPEPLALRLREVRPLRDAAAAKTIVVDRLLPVPFAVRLEGSPRRMTKPVELVVSAARAGELERALAAMEIVAMPDGGGAAAGKPGATTAAVSIDGPPLVTVELSLEGEGSGCAAGLVAIGGSTGPGCVERTRVDRVLEAVEALRAAPAEIVERRLVPFDPVRVTLPDGVVLDLEKRPRVGDRNADSARVAELLAVLATPMPEPVAVATAATAAGAAGATAGAGAGAVVNGPPKVVGTLVAVARSGAEIVVEVLASKQVRRRGERVAFAPGAGALAIVMRPSAALADTLLWSEEPTTIHAITIDGVKYTRGAVIGEWSDPKRAQALEALAEALAHPHGVALAKDPDPIVHMLQLEVVPPAGSPVLRTVFVGRNCEGAADKQPVVFDKQACDAITAAVR